MNNPAPLPPVASQHTPEPWRVLSVQSLEPEQHNCLGIVSDDNTVIARLDKWRGPAAAEMDANASRIVACVNALSGVADPAAYVAALETALREIALEVECAGIRLRDASIQARANNARAALAQRQP